MCSQVKQSIQAFTQPSAPLSIEHSLLISTILRLIEPPANQPIAHIPTPPDTVAARLSALKREPLLTINQVREILAACIDTRELSDKKREELQKSAPNSYFYSVRDVSWYLFNQPISFSEDALSLVIERLSDPDAMVCAMAARLLQNAKALSSEIRVQAMQKLMAVLADATKTSRSTPYNERIDDVLFETLQGLASS